jgi:hypothetical protein
MFTSSDPPDVETAWRVFFVLGAILAGLGGVNLLLLWIPYVSGKPEWEFGTAGTYLDIFPLCGLGFVLLISASVALGQRWTTRALAAVCVVVALLTGLVGVRYATALPQVLDVMADGIVRLHTTKTAVKAGLQAVLYPALLLIIAVRASRATWRAGLP